MSNPQPGPRLRRKSDGRVFETRVDPETGDTQFVPEPPPWRLTPGQVKREFDVVTEGEMAMGETFEGGESPFPAYIVGRKEPGMVVYHEYKTLDAARSFIAECGRPCQLVEATYREISATPPPLAAPPADAAEGPKVGPATRYVMEKLRDASEKSLDPNYFAIHAEHGGEALAYIKHKRLGLALRELGMETP